MVFSGKRAADVFVVLFCLGGMALCLWFFRQDLYRSLSRLNAAPVGTVTLKHRVAQRRSEDRLLWNYLQKTSPVYLGDFIRTGDRSQAALTLLEGGAVTDLGENTIIRIGAEKGTGQSRIELSGGALSFTAGSGGAVVVSGQNTLTLAPGGSVSAVSGDSGFAFRIDGGSAALREAGGRVETFRAGEGSGPENAWPGKRAGEGGAAAPLNPIRLILPAEGAVFRAGGEIGFRWAGGGDEGRPGGLYTLEVADNPAMEKAAVYMQVSGKRVVLSSMKTGRWYWRVSPVYGGNSAASPAASFTVREPASPAAGTNAAPAPARTSAAGTSAAPAPARTEAPPAPPPLLPPGGLRPENGYVLGPAQLRTSRSINFGWNPVPGAGAYEFSLYRETGGGRRLVESAEIPGSGYTFNKFNLLERGAFVWTVRALRSGSGGSERGSIAESRFTVDIPVLERHDLPGAGTLYGN